VTQKKNENEIQMLDENQIANGLVKLDRVHDEKKT
jgi:hypothetical protein